MKHAVPLHPDASRQRMRRLFVNVRGDVDARFRELEIGALPAVVWKGAHLRTLRCLGTTGRGPHNVNVPEALLWSLIDLRAYRCPYHEGSPLFEVPAS